MASDTGRREGLRASKAAGILLLLSLAGCAVGTNTGFDAGQVPSGAFSSLAPGQVMPPPPAAPSRTAGAAAPGEQFPAVMGASVPVTLSIPSISVQTDLLHLGLLENGSLHVPEDAGDGAPASWYNGSPTPGERGPSVMLGHVNSPSGRGGVFADLRKLAPGAEISVARTDGSVAVFSVDRGALYPKNEFPTFEVYGNTEKAELRLITCDGYDAETGEFDENYVIYATLRA